MSGGTFDYKQFQIVLIVDEIQEYIDKNGRLKTQEELQEGYAWDKSTHHHKYPDEVIDKFKEAVKILKQAKIYATRVDWLIAGDDSEKDFFKRLDEDLKELENE
jgi:hypothetical protein